MRLRVIRAFWAAVLFCAVLSAVQASPAALVIDAGSQSVKCDDEKLESRLLKPFGSQVGAFVQNTTTEPRKLQVKFCGLSEARYDLYVNGKYLGVKDAAELEKGFDLTVPGRIVDPRLVLCLETVKPLIEAEYSRLKDIRSPEPARICATLQQAIGWVRSSLQIEKTYRSLTVVAVPEGRVLQRPNVPTRLDDEDTMASVNRACSLLHEARSRMSSVIQDPDLRNSAVMCLTPVDFAASFAVKNGKPCIAASVTNYCNLPVSGKIVVTVPAGWKCEKTTWPFSNLASGKSVRADCILTRNKPNAPLPEGVKVAADLSMTHDGLRAHWVIPAIARTPELQSAVMPNSGSRKSSSSSVGPSTDTGK
ncbi:MAG: hypothetical protein QHI38_03915 [Armatimonadota bacterium]|nr:hypothetical protein [Armatimonadota bacterium]